MPQHTRNSWNLDNPASLLLSLKLCPILFIASPKHKISQNFSSNTPIDLLGARAPPGQTLAPPSLALFKKRMLFPRIRVRNADQPAPV